MASRVETMKERVDAFMPDLQKDLAQISQGEAEIEFPLSLKDAMIFCRAAYGRGYVDATEAGDIGDFEEIVGMPATVVRDLATSL